MLITGYFCLTDHSSFQNTGQNVSPKMRSRVFLRIRRELEQLISYQEQSVYVATDKIKEYGIKVGNQFYLDAQHKDHIEIFDKNGNFKGVWNLDGTRNEDKTIAGEGRKLPK